MPIFEIFNSNIFICNLVTSLFIVQDEIAIVCLEVKYGLVTWQKIILEFLYNFNVLNFSYMYAHKIPFLHKIKQSNWRYTSIFVVDVN